MIDCRRILIISELDCWSMGEGKGGPALYRTLTGYAERGWKVYFITGNRGQTEPPGLHESIHVIRFDARWLKHLMVLRKVGFVANAVWWFYFQIASCVKAQALRSRERFDLVYGYEVCGVPVVKVLSKLWHVPAVARFQGTSLGADWRTRRFRKLRAWEHVIGLRIPMDLVIMTNDGTQGDRVLHSLGADMQRVRFWMNGVDWELLRDRPEKAEARCLLGIRSAHMLLTVSRLVGWKRVDRSIQALPEVLSAYPDCLLAIVGDGPERGRLERLAADLGVMDRVRFEGAVPHSRIPTYLAAADIFLSLYDLSNVGNPLLEAMMAGKCIVTLNNGDTGRVIQDGRNAVLLEVAESSTLPEVISGLLGDGDRRDRLGAGARQFAEEHFRSWEERMDAEVAEVQKLAEQRGRRR